MLNTILVVAVALSTAAPPATPPETVAGGRADAKGRLGLPVSGLVVTVPKPHRAMAEVWGRIAPRPDGADRSDDIAVATNTSIVALSVVMTNDDCMDFKTLPDVDPARRIGRYTWSRLSQGVFAAETGAGRQVELETSVWCRPGLRVHVAAPVNEPTVGPWLDALVLARTRAPSEMPNDFRQILVENPETPDIVTAVAAKREFGLAAVRVLLETALPLQRVTFERPADISAADHFELLIPSAWQAVIAIERLNPDTAGCAPIALKHALRPLPDGWQPARGGDGEMVLCRSESDASSLRLRIRGDAPSAALLGVLEILAREIDAARR